MLQTVAIISIVATVIVLIFAIRKQGRVTQSFSETERSTNSRVFEESSRRMEAAVQASVAERLAEQARDPRLANMTQEDLVIVSPDEGSIKRTLKHKDRLGGSLAIVDKVRKSSTVIQSENIIGGPVEGKVALIFDDMISTAGSICAAANVVRSFGAREIHIAATHGVLCGKAVERLNAAPVESIVITDTIPLSSDKRNRLGSKLKQLSVSRLLGEAIRILRRRGVTMIEAQTMASNEAAKAFYLKFGFTEIDYGVVFRKESTL